MFTALLLIGNMLKLLRVKVCLQASRNVALIPYLFPSPPLLLLRINTTIAFLYNPLYYHRSLFNFPGNGYETVKVPSKMGILDIVYHEHRSQQVSNF